MPVEKSSLPDLVEALQLEQQERWRNGDRVIVESYLALHPGLRADPTCVLQLVYNEVLLRDAAGETPQLGEYVRRLPEFADQLTPLFEVHRAIESDRLLSAVGHWHSTAGTAPRGPEPPINSWPTIEGHEILSELGRGGMGVVYKARQLGLNRIVALKMILAGSHADAVQRSRFHTEAEAVARLQHTNIVQIHQVGGQDGCPYYSMEFVQGPSLADQVNGTPQPARDAAALIATLARAMHTAHQKGIVHRDLKPANILLQRQNEERTMENDEKDDAFSISHASFFIPKITDFGLAKLLDADAGQTGTGIIVGTPSYMAPEQAKSSQKEIGPATDVYAFGAILYELLTGRPPFRAQTQLETLRQVLANEPVSLARFDLKVPLDLNTICMKCLQKEPHQRYLTALELAEDLERFLTGQPILARPSSRLERVWKWAKRRPLVAVSLTFSGAALMALAVVWLFFTINLDRERIRADGEAQISREQRRRAESSRDRALAAIDKFLTRLGEEQLVNVPGMDIVRKDLLQDAVEMHQGLLQELDERDPALRRQVGLALQRVARIHWLLRQRDREEQAYRQARDIQQKLVAEFPDDAIYRRDLGKSLHYLAVLTRVNKSIPEAEEAFREVLALRKGLADRFPDEPDYRGEVAATLSSYSNIYHQTDWPKRRGILLEVLALQEEVLQKQPDSVERRWAVAGTHNELATLAFRMNNFAEAVAGFQHGIDFAERCLESDPNNDAKKLALAGACGNLAGVYLQQQRLSESLAAYDKAIAIRTELAAKHPAVPSYARWLGAHQLDRGQILQNLERWNEAAAGYSAAIDIFKVLTERYPRESQNGRMLGCALLGIARVDRQQGKWKEASSQAQTALGMLEKLLVKEPKSLPLTDDVASACIEHALDLQIMGSFSQARIAFDRAMTLAEGIRKREPKYFRTSEILHEGYEGRGDLLIRQGQLELACQDWERSAAEAGKNAESTKQVAITIDAMRRLARGDHQAACALIDGLCLDFGSRVDWRLTFRFTWVFSLAAVAAQRDPALQGEEQGCLVEGYHRRAVELLTLGARGGFFKHNFRRRLLLDDPVLERLRERSDYRIALQLIDAP